MTHPAKRFVFNVVLFKFEHIAAAVRCLNKLLLSCTVGLKWGNVNGTGTVAKANKNKLSFDVDAFLSSTEGGRGLLEFRKNHKIFNQGATADSVFYIQEGKIKICVISQRGKEAVVAIHGKGDFFGEGCLTGQPVRLATAIAMTECTVMRIERDAMARVLHGEPKFSDRFVAYILRRNARIEEDLVDQLFNSSEKRLARLLLLMANFGKPGKPEPIIAKVSQATLAEMVGTTRSRISTFMNKFRDLGFIEYNGDMKVNYSLMNMVLHETPEIKRNGNGK